MRSSSRILLGTLSVVACATGLLGQDADSPAAALVTLPMPFIGITPCRVADTRDASRPPGYGPPSLSAGVPRSFTIVGQCGIPAGAQAVSFNVTVANPRGNGYVLLYPKGGSQPGVSTVNYLDRTVANAAIAPLGSGGGITVAAAVNATDLILDVNGYFAGSAVDAPNTFLGVEAGNTTLTGLGNTGIGGQTLLFATVGHLNTAVGFSALLQTDNVFGGGGADVGNTGVGVGAIVSNKGGYPNTAIGANALHTYDGTNQQNVAIGTNSLHDALTIGNNIGIGNGTLSSIENVMLDDFNNLAIGYLAGSNLACEFCEFNLYVDNSGGANDNFVMRIGVLDTATYLAGVRGVQGGTGSLLVVVDSIGQWGTTSSSERYKRDIREMSPESEGLRALRPVTFRYKDQPRLMYGLIAEEVEQVLPDLVVCDAEGRPESVMYHELPAMLLNEVEKQDRQLGSAEAQGSRRREQLDALDESVRTERRRIAELLERLGGLEAERKPGSR